MNRVTTGNRPRVDRTSGSDQSFQPKSSDEPKVELNRDACVAMLEQATIGRIGVSIGALPAILPVNYVIFAETVAFPAASWNTAPKASTGVVIAFEVDGQGAGGALAWTVMVCGVSYEVTKEEDLGRFRSLWTLRHPTSPMPERFVAVPTTVISGHCIPPGR